MCGSARAKHFACRVWDARVSSMSHYCGVRDRIELPLSNAAATTATVGRCLKLTPNLAFSFAYQTAVLRVPTRTHPCGADETFCCHPTHPMFVEHCRRRSRCIISQPAGANSYPSFFQIGMRKSVNKKDRKQKKRSVVENLSLSQAENMH